MVKMKIKSRRQRRLRRPTPPRCYFCQAKKEPNWQDYQKLAEFLSPRGRILPRSLSGLCARHQRQLARAIKRARHLGLLPFVVKNQ